MENFENNLRAESSPKQEMTEAQFNATIEILKVKRDQTEATKIENRENLELDKYIDDKLNDYPSKLRDKVLKSLQRYKEEAGLNDEQLKVVVDIESANVKDAYLSEMTDLPNKSFMRADMISTIDSTFKQGVPSKEDLQKIAYIMFDLNGLKAVNDLNASHDKGDEFLKLAAQALKSLELQVIADKYQMKLSICHESGDEFSIKVIGEDPVSDEQLQELTSASQQALLEMEGASKLVDLENQEVAYRLYEAEAKAQGDNIEDIDSDVFQEFFNALPKDFQFKAYMSAGFSNIYDAIILTKKNSKNFLNADDSYEVGIGKALGAIFDTSNAAMDINKRKMKERIGKSTDAKDLMIARLWDIREGGKQLKENLSKSRAENKKLQEDLLKLIEENKKLKQGYADVREMLKEDVDKEAILTKIDFIEL